MGSGASGPRAVVVVVVAVVVVAHLPLFSKVTLEDAFSVEVEVEFPVVDAKTPRRRRFPGSLSNGAEEEEEEVAAAPTAVMVGPLGDTAVVRLKEGDDDRDRCECEFEFERPSPLLSREARVASSCSEEGRGDDAGDREPRPWSRELNFLLVAFMVTREAKR